jgi:maltooligosyltrehalose trehalohydrolase
MAEGLSAHHFVHFDQNHDQVGNRAMGERLEHLCGMEAAKVALGLVLMAPYVPMLFMGEEFATSAPFMYFADHDDEEMRRMVAEGRKREFADFAGGAEFPNPEEVETFEKSKLRWEEIGEGKHAEMLAWTKQLIHLRRSTMALNDGSMQHLRVTSDDRSKTLTMHRDEVGVLVNLGEQNYTFDVLEGDTLLMASREGVNLRGNKIDLPGMSLAVVECSRELMEDREVG